jgi:hypothetical protein
MLSVTAKPREKEMAGFMHGENTLHSWLSQNAPWRKIFKGERKRKIKGKLGGFSEQDVPPN